MTPYSCRIDYSSRLLTLWVIEKYYDEYYLVHNIYGEKYLCDGFEGVINCLLDKEFKKIKESHSHYDNRKLTNVEYSNLIINTIDNPCYMKKNIVNSISNHLLHKFKSISISKIYLNPHNGPVSLVANIGTGTTPPRLVKDISLNLRISSLYDEYFILKIERRMIQMTIVKCDQLGGLFEEIDKVSAN